MTDTKEETKTAEVVIFDKTVAAIAILQKEFLDENGNVKIYDVKTTEGMALAKAGRAKLRGYYVDLEKARLKEGEDARDHIKKLNLKAGGLDTSLKFMYNPINGQIKGEEERKAKIKEDKEKAEQKRKDDIDAKIDELKVPSTITALSTSEEIADILEHREALDLKDEDYEEFIGGAYEILKANVDLLHRMHDEAVAREEADRKLKAEQAQLEADRKDKERVDGIRELINNMKKLALTYAHCSADTLVGICETFGLSVPDKETFQEFTDEALGVHKELMEEFRKMHADAVKKEEEEVRLAKEKKEFEKEKEEADRKLRKEQAEHAHKVTIKEKIEDFKLQTIPTSSGHARHLLQDRLNIKITGEEYEEFTEDAQEALDKVITQLRIILEEAEAREKKDADLKDAQEKLDVVNRRRELINTYDRKAIEYKDAETGDIEEELYALGHTISDDQMVIDAVNTAIADLTSLLDTKKKDIAVALDFKRREEELKEKENSGVQGSEKLGGTGTQHPSGIEVHGSEATPDPVVVALSEVLEFVIEIRNSMGPDFDPAVEEIYEFIEKKIEVYHGK